MKKSRHGPWLVLWILAVVLTCHPINTLPLRVGTLFCIAGGYLGGTEWIEADPDFKKVIIVCVPAINNPWFQEPVNVMRWTELETK